MSKKSTILALLIMAFFSQNIYAQENFVTFDQLKLKLLTIKNPFQSKLPIKKEPVEPENKPKIEPTQDEPKMGPPPSKPVVEVPEVKVEPPVPVPSFTVTGIVWDTDRPQAIMNGQIVNLGDTVVGVKITDIQKAAIHGTFNGENIIIKP